MSTLDEFSHKLLASSPGIFSWHCIDLVYDKLNSADAIEAPLDLFILLVVSAFIRSNIGPKFRAEITHNLIIASRAKTGSHQTTSTLGKVCAKTNYVRLRDKSYTEKFLTL